MASSERVLFNTCRACGGEIPATAGELCADCEEDAAIAVALSSAEPDPPYPKPWDEGYKRRSD